MICHCRREAKGFYYQRRYDDPRVWCCSLGCLDNVYEVKGMIDPTASEIAAIEAASDPAGEYIESLGRTDMASWSRDEWLGFIECVVTGYTDAMQRIPAKDHANANGAITAADVPF
jgi:hypothetical protein